MMISVINDWLLPISTWVALFSVAGGSLLAVWEYHLKSKAEKRLQYTSQVEIEIRLLKLFTEIMNIAHGRSGYTVSEKAVEQLFHKDVITKADLDNLEEPENQKKLNKKLASVAILTLPVGEAAQDAAIAAVATLAKNHRVLRDVGIQGLESMRISIKSKREIVEKYLNTLK